VGGVSDEQGWVWDDAAKARVAVALAEIDAKNARQLAAGQLFECALCGQLVRALDKFGLCSKDKGEHAEWRVDVAPAKATGRRGPRFA
jgi:hypothetical protein